MGLVAMLAAAVATLASTSGPAPRYTPQFPPSWDVKQSTWVMACNYSGFLSPEITASWGVVNKFVGDTILGAPWPCHGARPPSSSRASGPSVAQWWCPAWWRPVVAQGCGRHICDGRDGLKFESASPPRGRVLTRHRMRTCAPRQHVPRWISTGATERKSGQTTIRWTRRYVRGSTTGNLCRRLPQEAVFGSQK